MNADKNESERQVDRLAFTYSYRFCFKKCIL